MRFRLTLDPALAAGLAGSLLFHGAAIGAVALVRFDPGAAPLQVDLVELAAPAPPAAPVEPARPPRAAQPAPERPAPALPPDPRDQPRVSLAPPAPALPEHAVTPQRAHEDPPSLAVPRAKRAEPVMTAVPARPERPLAQERSDSQILSTVNSDPTALPEKVERRPAASEVRSTRKPEQPSLALARPLEPARSGAEPTVALGQTERGAEPHLAALLSSRAPDWEPPAASPESPSSPPATTSQSADHAPSAPPAAPSVSAPPHEIAVAAPNQPVLTAPAPTPRPSPPPAGGQLQAALPPGALNAGPIIAPRLTTSRKPRYPEAARQAGAEGTVFVKAYVLADGSVRDARVERSAGNAALDGAALETIREARFVPAQRSGRAVPVWVEIPVDFKLER
jgi:periplasmic protein TonB